VRKISDDPVCFLRSLEDVRKSTDFLQWVNLSTQGGPPDIRNVGVHIGVHMRDKMGKIEATWYE